MDRSLRIRWRDFLCGLVCKKLLALFAFAPLTTATMWIFLSLEGKEAAIWCLYCGTLSICATAAILFRRGWLFYGVPYSESIEVRVFVTAENGLEAQSNAIESVGDIELGELQQPSTSRANQAQSFATESVGNMKELGELQQPSTSSADQDQSCAKESVGDMEKLGELQQASADKARNILEPRPSIWDDMEIQPWKPRVSFADQKGCKDPTRERRGHSSQMQRGAGPSGSSDFIMVNPNLHVGKAEVHRDASDSDYIQSIDAKTSDTSMQDLEDSEERERRESEERERRESEERERRESEERERRESEERERRESEERERREAEERKLKDSEHKSSDSVSDPSKEVSVKAESEVNGGESNKSVERNTEDSGVKSKDTSEVNKDDSDSESKDASAKGRVGCIIE